MSVTTHCGYVVISHDRRQITMVTRTGELSANSYRAVERQAAALAQEARGYNGGINMMKKPGSIPGNRRM